MSNFALLPYNRLYLCAKEMLGLRAYHLCTSAHEKLSQHWTAWYTKDRSYQDGTRNSNISHPNWTISSSSCTVGWCMFVIKSAMKWRHRCSVDGIVIVLPVIACLCYSKWPFHGAIVATWWNYLCYSHVKGISKIFGYTLCTSSR